MLYSGGGELFSGGGEAHSERGEALPGELLAEVKPIEESPGAEHHGVLETRGKKQKPSTTTGGETLVEYFNSIQEDE